MSASKNDLILTNSLVSGLQLDKVSASRLDPEAVYLGAPDSLLKFL